MAKFSEALWRGLFYSCFCILGIVTLSSTDATWISDTTEHWNNWPHHPISSLMHHYYQIELGCYLHQLYWTEIVRSDWLEMTIHHIITITLIVASYLTNFTRIGCSILVPPTVTVMKIQYNRKLLFKKCKFQSAKSKEELLK